MKLDPILESLKELGKRVVSEGGFSSLPKGTFRPDATAWAILVFQAYDQPSPILDKARSHLASAQESDGRIPISPDHPEAIWPTALAILAWQHSPAHQVAQEKAIQFLLNTTGHHWESDDTSIISHDPSLHGWPWTADTHSWIEPTALSILALDIVGHGHHPRVQEAVRMILDRQIHSGGWNYGNTAVLRRELRPFPETTGVALDALYTHSSRNDVQHSLQYLSTQLLHVRTPISLGWGLLGLGAWDSKPQNFQILVQEGLRLQHRYGPYDTSSLCLLLASSKSHKGLRQLLEVPSQKSDSRHQTLKENIA